MTINLSKLWALWRSDFGAIWTLDIRSSTVCIWMAKFGRRHYFKSNIDDSKTRLDWETLLKKGSTYLNILVSILPKPSRAVSRRRYNSRDFCEKIKNSLGHHSPFSQHNGVVYFQVICYNLNTRQQHRPLFRSPE